MQKALFRALFATENGIKPSSEKLKSCGVDRLARLIGSQPVGLGGRMENSCWSDLQGFCGIGVFVGEYSIGRNLSCLGIIYLFFSLI